MAQPHQDLVLRPGGAPERLGQLVVDHQRVVADRVERRGYALPQFGPVVEHRAEPPVHRVGRVEEQRLAAVSAEYEERVQEELVAAVAENELVRRRPPSLAQGLPKLLSPAGIAVQNDALELRRREVLRGRIALGPLVRVDPYVGLQHLGAVRLELGDRGAWRGEFSFGHRSLA